MIEIAVKIITGNINILFLTLDVSIRTENLEFIFVFLKKTARRTSKTVTQLAFNKIYRMSMKGTVMIKCINASIICFYYMHLCFYSSLSKWQRSTQYGLIIIEKKTKYLDKRG